MGAVNLGQVAAFIDSVSVEPLAQGVAPYVRNDGTTSNAEFVFGLPTDSGAAAEQARQAANDSRADSLKSEGYALGTQGGTAVTDTSPYYHNNSKYYSEQSADSATAAAAAEERTRTMLSTKQDVLTFDTEPTAGSSNPVTSGGVYTAIANLGGYEANMTNDKLIKWNAIAKRIETTPYAASDIASLIAAVAEMELQGNLDTYGGVLSPTPRWLRFDPESKKSLVIKAQTIIKVGTRVYKAESDESFDLTTYLNAVGKDYFVYLNWAEVDGADSWSLSASLTKSADTATSRYIGRLHTLCAAVPAGTSMTAPAAPSSGIVIGDDFLVKPYTDKDADFKEFYTQTVSAITTGTYYDVVTCGHPLAGFGAGDILPESVFCLTFKPDTLFEDAMVYEPTLGVAIDVYLQSGKGNGTRSLFGASTTRTRPQISHEADMLAVGKRLLSDEEFQAAALGSNEKTSIQGTVEASIQTAGGHVDTASRRMTSAIGCEDCCGGVWQWLRDVSALGTGTAYTNISGQGEYVGNTGWITIDGQDDFGQMYNCSTVLVAGGAWYNRSNCGSRARDTSCARSGASAHYGGRGSSRVIRGH